MGKKMAALKKEAPLRAPKDKAFHLQRTGLVLIEHFGPLLSNGKVDSGGRIAQVFFSNGDASPES